MRKFLKFFSAAVLPILIFSCSTGNSGGNSDSITVSISENGGRAVVSKSEFDGYKNSVYKISIFPEDAASVELKNEGTATFENLNPETLYTITAKAFMDDLKVAEGQVQATPSDEMAQIQLSKAEVQVEATSIQILRDEKEQVYIKANARFLPNSKLKSTWILSSTNDEEFLSQALESYAQTTEEERLEGPSFDGENPKRTAIFSENVQETTSSTTVYEAVSESTDADGESYAALVFFREDEDGKIESISMTEARLLE